MFMAPHWKMVAGQFVLAEGINNFRIKRALADVWDWERCLVISQYDPDTRFGARWSVTG